MTVSARSLTRSAAALALVAASAVSLGGAQSRPTQDPLSSLRRQVADYMAIKARIVSAHPPRSAARTFDEYLTANTRLRDALRHARAGVRPGNIFTHDARGALQAAIALALDEHGISVRDLLADMADERPPDARPVRINEPFPWERGARVVPCLLEALPGLPRDLQYRLDDRRLVLIDVDVNLVLDVMEDALVLDGQ